MQQSFLLLIAEHSAMPLKKFSHGVLKHEHRIINASHGQSCLQFAETGNPDVIILDTNLPDISGLQVIQKLRNREILKRIPLIVITDAQTADTLEQPGNDDIFATIKKPYRMKQLEELIVMALETRIAAQKKILSTNTHYIEVLKDNYRYVFKFRNGWSQNLETEIKRVFTNQLAKEIPEYKVILDLRNLSTLTSQETVLLEKFVLVFTSNRVHILAGRHFGILLAETELDDIASLFLSTEELIDFFKMSAQKAV